MLVLCQNLFSFYRKINGESGKMKNSKEPQDMDLKVPLWTHLFSSLGTVFWPMKEKKQTFPSCLDLAQEVEWQ